MNPSSKARKVKQSRRRLDCRGAGASCNDRGICEAIIAAAREHDALRDNWLNLPRIRTSVARNRRAASYSGGASHTAQSAGFMGIIILAYSFSRFMRRFAPVC
jgi:transposase